MRKYCYRKRQNLSSTKRNMLRLQMLSSMKSIFSKVNLPEFRKMQCKLSQRKHRGKQIGTLFASEKPLNQ